MLTATTMKTTKRQRTRDKLLVAAQEVLMDASSEPLSVRAIAKRAGVVQGTFYNYFRTVEEVLDHIGLLLAAEHQRLAVALGAHTFDVEARVAALTRLTFLLVAETPGFGRILFDSGLPIDRFVAGLRMRMTRDLRLGLKEGTFKIERVEVARSLFSGAMIGAALDIHRGMLPAEAIEHTAAQMLQILGVAPERAHALTHRPMNFPKMDPLPLSLLEVIRNTQRH